MALLRLTGRVLAIFCGLILTVVGVVSLGVAYLPDNQVAGVAGRLAVRLGALAIEPLGLFEQPRVAMTDALSGLVLRFMAAPAGLILMVAALLPGAPSISRKEGDSGATLAPEGDGRTRRKLRKQAAGLARSAGPLEAAEFCFDSGLMDEAADYFVEADQWVRAAEIRHDQGRFIDSGELYMKAERFDVAGRVFAQQDEHARAAEAYREAGNYSVAAELFEKAEDHPQAALCYEKSGFPRHAAQEYVKCGSWEQAATCLEQTIGEEISATRGGASNTAQVQKLVRMAGNLFERAELNERAEAVLVRGEMYAAAAEIALRHGRDERAAELFAQAKDAPRAAEVLQKLGRQEEAALSLAEHHRDLGDQDEAARCFEQAGELMAAGDIYRLLEQYDRAADCYERFGDAAQAAEMFALAGDPQRASLCYEQAGLFAEAAECVSADGDEIKQAELLTQAGDHVRSAEIHLAAGRQDEAIASLQQVHTEDDAFASATAMLGDVFRDRGQHSLAIKKLRQSTHGKEIDAGNARAFYGLAAALEANGEINEADELYERILSFDYNFMDVQQCLDRTRELIAGQSAKATGTEAAPMTRTAKQGRYEIVGKLGRGGMGVVYKAIDSVLDRTVAFKVLPDALRENPQALKNFLREAKSAAKLNHPGIVTVYDAGEQDGVFYIAMEHVDGNTLKEIVKQRGKISNAGIIHVVTQMCEALAYAHEKKVVHRDIKTANAMWTRERKAKIMDFGLAKVIEEVRNHTTVVSGTPYYMSPEQTLGKNVDHRTDIYSLGVTIFELATGTLPFREGNLPYHHVHTTPPDAREFNADLPPLIASVIARCLQKQPDDRYQSAREIVAELADALREAAQSARGAG